MKQNTYLATYYVCHSNCDVELTKAYVYGFNRGGAVSSLMDKPDYLCMVSIELV